MAGDWIKMREGLHEDPAVVEMAERLQTRPEHVVGYCHRFWSWVSQHSHDGLAKGVTCKSLGSVLALPAEFLPLMVEVGWLEEMAGGLRIPKFENHLSSGAKARARNAENQRSRRVTKMSPTTGDNIPSKIRRAVYQRDDHRCRYCGFQQGSKAATGEYIGALISIDHVIPSSLGGATSLSNCVCCCTVCNRKKNGRTPDEAGMILSPSAGDNSTPEKRREEKSLSIASAIDICPVFEAFWKSFPVGRRKSKGEAQKAFKQALKKTTAEVLIAAAKEYAASNEGRGDYVKMPSTWLNQECWNDDRTAWNRSNGNAKQAGWSVGAGQRFPGR